MESRINVILSDIGRKACIQIPKIACTYETGRGEGYMSKVKMLEVTDEADIETISKIKQMKLSVVVKQSPNDAKMHAQLPVARLYQLEILFYSKIAPALYELQLEYDAKCLNFAKCFYTNDAPLEEIIIIENLREKGYAVLDREVPMKYAHMKMAFEELAKLHALCFALKKLKPEVYKELTEPLLCNTFYEAYKIGGFEAFIGKVTGNFRKHFINTKYYDIFCAFSDRIMHEFYKSNTIDEYAVFCHGDAWCNNIMYTHDASGKPTSAMFIDFQLNRIQSPVTDLSYLFYGCVDIGLLPKLNDLLQYYHNTMAKHLEMFGLDVEQIYSWKKLIEHWKKYGKQGFIVSFLMRVIMLSTPEESPDVSEAMDKGESIMLAAYYYKMKREDEYNRTIQAIVKYCIDEKYIY